jgi:hypothetical protein
MENWLKIKDYAEVNGITTQAVYKRINKGSIPEDRIRKNDGGIIEIKLADIEDLKVER